VQVSRDTGEQLVLERLDELIVPLVSDRAPGLLALHGVGPDTAALLLNAAGDHPARLRSEASWAHLYAAAPIPTGRTGGSDLAGQ
jgi:transposase